MKLRTLLPLVATVVMFGLVRAHAGDVKVIANSSVRPDSITAAELRSLFLGEKRSLNDGSHIEPVLAKRGTAHEAFLKRYLGKSDDALQTYYRTLVFTGTGLMPKVLSSDVEIVTYVAQTKGAIGYVDVSTPAEGVKVLTILQNGSKGERRLLTRVEPEYPETLLKLRIGGTVRLEVTVSAKGAVESVTVLGGNPILGEAAAKAAKQWVYSPWPTQTHIEVAIPFEPHP